MELESLEYKVVMDAGADTEMLARAKTLDIGLVELAGVYHPVAITFQLTEKGQQRLEERRRAQRQ